MSDSRTYEMLWDCKFCGQKKLLGKTHRHCPNCGAPQDHTARYFPAEHEKVAVEDHRFVGADLRCPSCGEASSAAAKHCGNCGGPLENAKAVAMRSDRVEPEGGASSPNAGGLAQLSALGSANARSDGSDQTKRSSARTMGCAGIAVFALLIGGLVLFFLWKKPTTLEVTGHRWTRAIEVERFQTVEERTWCNELPSGARVLSREKRERAKKQVADGEECSVRKKDRGDGTFTEARECKPKYRDEPVYEDHCRFDIDRWAKARTETASGASLAQAPVWPDVKLTQQGQCLGCEREGKREAAYTLLLRDGKSNSAEECNLDEGVWRGYALGQKVDAEVRRIGGGLDCSSLRPSK